MARKVRVLSKFYGSVLLTRIYSSEEFMVKLKASLGEAFKNFETSDNIERASFCQVVSFGQRISILCLL